MTARVAGRRRLSATRRARTEHWPGGRANARNCDGPMSAGGTMTAPSCRVHGWAGCWQAAPVDPARLQSIGPADAPMLTAAMVPAWWCKLWAMRASGRRRASEADGCSKGLPAAWCACAQSIGPGIRADARICIGFSFEVVDFERGARGKRWWRWPLLGHRRRWRCSAIAWAASGSERRRRLHGVVAQG